MQRWRVLFYVAIASAFLAAPSWLFAQQAKPANPAPAPVPVAAAPAAESALELFAPLTQYALAERIGLILTLLIAVSGLGMPACWSARCWGPTRAPSGCVTWPTPCGKEPGPT